MPRVESSPHYPEGITVRNTHARRALRLLTGAALLTGFGQNATNMFNNRANLTIQQMTLQHGNGSGGNGGALSDTGSIALTGVLVQNNAAPGFDGGGLYLNDQVANLTLVTVRNNEAKL